MVKEGLFMCLMLYSKCIIDIPFPNSGWVLCCSLGSGFKCLHVQVSCNGGITGESMTAPSNLLVELALEQKVCVVQTKSKQL